MENSNERNDKKNQTDQQKPSKKAGFLQSTTSFIGAILAVLAVRWILFEPYVIPSGSMIPTLLIHDHILVNKFAYGIRLPFSKTWLWKFSPPKKGDIVVFRSVEDDSYFMIKRVIGEAGDTIQYDNNGQLTINGEALPHVTLPDQIDPEKQKPFYPVTNLDLGMDFSSLDFFQDQLGTKSFRTLLIKDAYRWKISPLKVGEGKLFMMGDNRDNSKDSRAWGELPQENLLGKAMFVWLSCEETLPVVNFLCNPLTIRWKRFFHAIK
ncbi:MAG: signal peptidase I [Bdellovibrionales bacterium]|nr:signal peptidase I [Bdellovibrionales bacterium]